MRAPRRKCKRRRLWLLYCIVFIHFYSSPHGVSLSEALPTTAIDTVSEFYTRKRKRQLQVKDLPKVPTWQLERDSNPRPSGRNLYALPSTMPMSHHAPQYMCSTFDAVWSE